MVKIGNQRKYEQCVEAQAMTADVDDLRKIIKTLEGSIALKKDKYD